MSPEDPRIPYEKQFDREATRTCGAACLSMVYASLGQEVSQRLLWPVIAKKNQYGSIASTTYLMTADALSRGFSAVAFQSRDPLQSLRLCRESGVRAILNHRLKPDSPAGHFTVFVDIDDTHVTLHDPYFGAARRIEHSVLLDLWQPKLPNSEVVGNFLIGIASDPPPGATCKTCQTPALARVTCPRCKNDVFLRPAALLGCANNSCAERFWNYICCPSCDLTWNFTVEEPRTSAATAAAPTSATPSADAPAAPPAFTATPSDDADPMGLAKVFEQLDRFCSQILAIPAAVSHPDVQKQLEFLGSAKQNLVTVQAEALANRKVHKERLAAMVQAADARKDAHQKKLDELNKPLAPLDGDALVRALLKNLGFVA